MIDKTERESQTECLSTKDAGNIVASCTCGSLSTGGYCSIHTEKSPPTSSVDESWLSEIIQLKKFRAMDYEDKLFSPEQCWSYKQLRLKYEPIDVTQMLLDHIERLKLTAEGETTKCEIQDECSALHQNSIEQWKRIQELEKENAELLLENKRLTLMVSDDSVGVKDAREKNTALDLRNGRLRYTISQLSKERDQLKAECARLREFLKIALDNWEGLEMIYRSEDTNQFGMCSAFQDARKALEVTNG